MAEINLLHVHGGAIGYGRLGVELTKTLRNRGITVFDDLPSPNEPVKAADKLLVRGAPGEAPHETPIGTQSGIANVICWISTPGHAKGWWKGQHASIFTMFEATELPEGFRDSLHNFETVIVPSDQNVELFGQYHDNVHRVLLGVDPDVWHYVPRKDPGVFFDFLIGGSGARKGTDLAYRAFVKLFGDFKGSGPIPRLVMKNPKGEEEFQGHDRVEMISGRVSPEEEVAIYANAHCYLQPSRGEGFGLQPLQAIAQGCPTILTDAHGHKSFAQLGEPVPVKELTDAAYFIFGDAGQWWEPDFDILCDRMRWVYDNYDRAQSVARGAANTVAKCMTWDNTADQFLAVFGDELNKPVPMAPGIALRSLDSRIPDLHWFTPDQKHFLVRVNKPWQADINGIMYQFLPGQDYHELAETKRVLFEAGLLDPSCLPRNMDDGSHGLTEQQVGRIPEYTAAHSHCSLCGQRLNSQPTRSDDLLAVGSG